MADQVAKETKDTVGFTLDLIPSVRQLGGFPSRSNRNCGSWDDRERSENIWEDSFTSAGGEPGNEVYGAICEKRVGFGASFGMLGAR